MNSEDAMSQKTIYHNGKIATNSTPYLAEAMAVGDGKVLATGTSSNLLQTREAGTKLVDLGGHTVIPITWSFAGMVFHLWPMQCAC
jgi:predicted amidohydrolase YtcJ